MLREYTAYIDEIDMVGFESLVVRKKFPETTTLRQIEDWFNSVVEEQPLSNNCYTLGVNFDQC